jgi:nucleoside-diphosphate-sugar epimerase
LLSGTRFLITGATGRLGRDLTARLEELGAEVDPLVLPGYPDLPKLVPWTARTRPRPVTGPETLRELAPPDHVIHLHWRVDRTRPFTRQIVGELEENIHRPSFLWDWLREHPPRSLLNCSSVGVFSHLNGNPISAEDEPIPLSPYGVAKLAGEKTLSALLGTTTTVLHIRLGSVCSVGEHPSQLFTRIRESLRTGTRITLNAGHVAHYLYIDEAVDLLLCAARQAPPGRYIVAGEGRRIEDIAGMFERLSGEKVEAEFVDLAPGVGDPEFVSDVERFRAPWVRVTPLEEAVARFLAEAAA